VLAERSASLGMVMWSTLNFSFGHMVLVRKQDQPFPALGGAFGSSELGVNKNDGRGAFHQFLATFDWSKPWRAEDEWQRFCMGLVEFNHQEPQVAINSTCLPLALLTPDDVRCEDRPTAQFEGKRKQPAKVGHAIQFGFDVDTLEVQLNELCDAVDKFFVVERKPQCSFQSETT
jgi:hypothetical protein